MTTYSSRGLKKGEKIMRYDFPSLVTGYRSITANDTNTLYIYNLVALHCFEFSQLLHLFSLKSFFLPVIDGGRLFEIFSLLPLSDNPFFLNHSLESFQRFLQRFVFVDFYESYSNHPLSHHGKYYGSTITYYRMFVNMSSAS